MTAVILAAILGMLCAYKLGRLVGHEHGIKRTLGLMLLVMSRDDLKTILDAIEEATLKGVRE